MTLRDNWSHLLSLCVRLPQWSSANSPSSRPLSTTLWKFTMGRLSIPGFSAPSLVPTQVRKHENPFLCHQQLFILSNYQMRFGQLAIILWHQRRGQEYNNHCCCFSRILYIRDWLNPQTNSLHRQSCCACRWAPVNCKTIQHWQQQFPWYISSLKKHKNIKFENEKHHHVWPNKPLDLLLPLLRP